MATVGDRLAEAQASGDPARIRQALHDARASGADPKQIDQALAELDRVAAASGSSAGAAPAASTDATQQPDAEAAAAAELRASAEGFKKRGNERLKENTKSAAREALELFTSGLEVRCSDHVLNAQLHSNRAHVRMLLRQFVEAVDDCRKAIDSDPKNIKAYWRAAKASLHLDLCRNGIDFCEAGLQQSPKDADLIKLRDSCAEKLESQRQRRVQRASAAPGPGLGSSEFNADEAMAVQEKVSELSEQVDIVRATIAGKSRQRARAVLTQQSMAECSQDTRFYRPAGRAFLLGDRGSLEESLKKEVDGIEQEVPKLQKKQEEFEKRKEAAEKELQEMVTAFQRQTQAAAGAGAASAA
eukprot:TRINITY_DN74114_c0_g1_i1.p1 TRINITY_DN74114_c0_g1~~TRINITY_DN74114_c0_g1_i1.p1  ORF type:complete len:357 (+),score=110.42 TRINITY_DN74114_c0_g1_i1:35-1105(+)